MREGDEEMEGERGGEGRKENEDGSCPCSSSAWRNGNTVYCRHVQERKKEKVWNLSVVGHYLGS